MRFGLRENDDVLIVDLSGEIRFSEISTVTLQQLITEHLSSGKRKFLLNFAKVDFIDSYGIGDIVSAHMAVKDKKGTLKFVHLSDKLWIIFNYSGLTRVFEIFDSEDKALKSFA